MKAHITWLRAVLLNKVSICHRLVERRHHLFTFCQYLHCRKRTGYRYLFCCRCFQSSLFLCGCKSIGSIGSRRRLWQILRRHLVTLFHQGELSLLLRILTLVLGCQLLFEVIQLRAQCLSLLLIRVGRIKRVQQAVVLLIAVHRAFNLCRRSGCFRTLAFRGSGITIKVIREPAHLLACLFVLTALVAQFVGFEFVSRQLFGSRLRYAVVQSLLCRTLVLVRRGKDEPHREGEKQSQPTED